MILWLLWPSNPLLSSRSESLCFSSQSKTSQGICFTSQGKIAIRSCLDLKLQFSCINLLHLFWCRQWIIFSMRFLGQFVSWPSTNAKHRLFWIKFLLLLPSCQITVWTHLTLIWPSLCNFQVWVLLQRFQLKATHSLEVPRQQNVFLRGDNNFWVLIVFLAGQEVLELFLKLLQYICEHFCSLLFFQRRDLCKKDTLCNLQTGPVQGTSNATIISPILWVFILWLSFS